MFQTKNDLPEKTRRDCVALLQQRLADGIDLMHQAKQAHWNVKGANFIALHELFDKIHEETENCVDLLAERIAQLGGIAEGTCKAVAKKTSLPEYPLVISDGPDHVDALSNSLAQFAKSIREAIDEASNLDDLGTADIFTEISRTVDKNLWFVEAHLPVPKAGAARGAA